MTAMIRILLPYIGDVKVAHYLAMLIFVIVPGPLGVVEWSAIISYRLGSLQILLLRTGE